jgi:hypothetical protein
MNITLSDTVCVVYHTRALQAHTTTAGAQEPSRAHFQSDSVEKNTVFFFITHHPFIALPDLLIGWKENANMAMKTIVTFHSPSFICFSPSLLWEKKSRHPAF